MIEEANDRWQLAFGIVQKQQPYGLAKMRQGTVVQAAS